MAVDREYCVVSRRSDSLATGQRRLVIGVLVAVSLKLTAGFPAVGAWLVLAYYVLEIGALARAFRCIERCAAD